MVVCALCIPELCKLEEELVTPTRRAPWKPMKHKQAIPNYRKQAKGHKQQTAQSTLEVSSSRMAGLNRMIYIYPPCELIM